LWKISQTKFLFAFSKIGKYPKSCFASDLLRRHMGILPNDTYIGCNWLFPNVSVVVTFKYNMIDNNLAPEGKDSYVIFYHIAVFCSL